MEYYFDLHGLEVQTSNGISQELPKWIINEILQKLFSLPVKPGSHAH